MAAKRLTRKEIVHKDPIQVALEATSAWILRNRVLLVAGLLILSLAIIGVYGWNSYSSSRGDEMQTAFAEGLDLYHDTVQPEEEAAPDAEETASDQPQPTYDFATDSERIEAALESFQATADEYEGTKIGDLALYYTALCNIDLDRKQEALPILEGIIAESDHRDVRNLARNSASQLAAEDNNLERAITLLQEIVEEPSENYPVQFTLMNIAMLHEAEGDIEEAIAVYQEVAAEYAETSSAAEAQTKITALDPKGEYSNLLPEDDPFAGVLPAAE